MLGHRELVVEDYIDILRRRRWVILLPLLIVPLLAWVTAKIVPPRFVSTTLVLIEQKRVPDDYVKPVTTEDLNGRLASLKEQIYSRTRLEPIITRFQLYASQHITMDDKLDLMRKAIIVQPIKSELVTRVNGMPGFTISFTSDTANTAQQVCGEITSLFLSENLRRQQAAVQGTVDFVSGQLDNAKAALDEQDTKLAAFQRAHFGEMPVNSQNNLTILQTLSTQLDATTQNIAQLQQNRLYLDTMLAQTAQDAAVSGKSDGSGQSLADLQTQLDKMVAAESDMESRYAPDYPDVARLKRDIETQKKKIADAKAAPPAAPGTGAKVKEAPAMAQMRAQLQAANRALDDKKMQQEQLKQRIVEYQKRVQSSPGVQGQLNELSRGYTTALQNYNDLLEKRNHSEMAGDLEKKQQGEQFRVIDPPNLPDSPTFPDLRIFLGAGVVLGIMMGIMLAAFLEYRDRSVRNERDIFAFTKLPTLGTIPVISATLEAPKRRLFGWFRKSKHHEYAGVQG
ncbi:MAG: Wzz/FepE/Etk N-terminal domain-containing protein [Acidobacteriaceae bacterium]